MVKVYIGTSTGRGTLGSFPLTTWVTISMKSCSCDESHRFESMASAFCGHDSTNHNAAVACICLQYKNTELQHDKKRAVELHTAKPRPLKNKN